MTSALDKVLAATRGPEMPAPDETVPLMLAAQAGLADAFLVLASDNDSDDDDDGDGDNDHEGHATYKKLTGKGMDKTLAAKMCARADKKVAATAMVGSVLAALEVALSVTQEERDQAKSEGNSLPDGSYPIRNTKQLHAAAVLAASHHGDWKAAQSLIRRRAKDLSVDINSLPGFGDSGDGSDKVAATMVVLAGTAVPAMVESSAVMRHEPFSGQHTHPHFVQAAHAHGHFHNGDNHHEHHGLRHGY